MDVKLIMEKLGKKQNGSFFRISWMSSIPVSAAAKKQGVTAYKIVDAVCRKGIRYKNQKSVQMKVDAGKILTHELPWGEWVPNYEGLLIQHKGNEYIRLYLAPNKPKVSFLLNGLPATYDDLKKSGCILNSWLKNQENPSKPDALTIKTETIQMIF